MAILDIQRASYPESRERPPRIARMSSKTQRAEKGIPNALARFGFFARGTVYVVVGGLAARVAIVQRGHALGPAGALAKILAGWNGRLALWIVAAGLLAFVLFRAAQCLRTRSRLARIGYGALGSLFLAVTAVRVLLHFHAGGDAEALREASARLVSHAWGRGALELGGAIAVVVGVLEALRAAVGKLPADFTAAIMARGRKRWTTGLARVGVLAHGAVVAVTGYSVFRAGLEGNPRGLSGAAAALRTIKGAENGSALFALAAAGLIAYGLSLLVLAAHRLKRSR
jgi:hypothetical protein